MKKGFKKELLALVLVGVMLLSVVGCGNQSANEPVQSNTPAPTSSTEATPSAPAVRAKITAAIYDRNNVPPSEGTITDNRWTKWINENAPVDVEFVAIPRNSSGEKYNLLFASGSAPDFIEEFSVANMNTFYSNKLLMPLNDVVDKNSTNYKALLEKYPALRNFLTKEDGQMYTFGVTYSASSNHYLVVRKDWLANVGLTAPKTVDEFIAICDAFTNGDPDKNGKKDTLALSLAGVSGSVMDAMFGGLGTWTNDWEIRQSGVKYGWEHVLAAVQMKEKIYDAGYVDRDYATDKDGTKAEQDFLNGKIGIYGINGGKNNTLKVLTTLQKNNPDADFEAIALPTTEFGSFSPAGGVFLQSNAAINAACKNPEAVMAYVDWLNTKETKLMLRYGGDEYSQIDPVTGGMAPKDAEKFKTEVQYAGDFHMTSSSILDPYNDMLPFNKNEPLQKRAYDIVLAAEKIYLDPNIMHVQLTNMPALPQDLTLIMSTIGTAGTGNQINDLYVKAILSGDSYNADQAVADAKKVFEQSGGDKLTEYYANYFKNNPNAIITDEQMGKVLPAYLK